MNALLSKLRPKSDVSSASGRSESQSTAGSSQEEMTLADEQDPATGGLTGTLQLADDVMGSPTETNKAFPYTTSCDGSSPASNNISFEVISAEVIREGRSGHVNYTILMKPPRSCERRKETAITRRYSDFEILNQRLKKRFPSIMSQVSFPRKVLTGNFTSATIAKRSTAFEQYLSHLFSNFDIRYSHEFMEFFVQDNFDNAVKHFLSHDFHSAAQLFERTLPVLDRLYGESHPHTFHCVGALVVCYSKTDKPNLALTCAKVALRCSTTADDEIMATLLHTTIRLSWLAGEDKSDLEQKLEVVRSRLSSQGFLKGHEKGLLDILTEAFKLGSKR